MDNAGGSAPGAQVSGALVQGRPAAAYAAGQGAMIKYARESENGGASWGTVVTVEEGPSAGLDVSLAVVNGNPAICYFDKLESTLKYVRAQDGTGSAWGEPVSVAAGAGPTDDFSMEVADGNPAVCFIGGCCEDLMYVRATDPNGSAWGNAVLVDIGDTKLYQPSMRVVGGRPAIAYASNTNLWYVQAADSAGNAWQSSVIAAGSLAQSGSSRYPSLLEVVGRPAIAFRRDSTAGLTYLRAANVPGTAWGQPVSVDPGGIGSYCSLSVINGNPAMAYFNISASLKYVQAKDASGGTATAWNAPVTVDRADLHGSAACLLESGGRPAVFYRNLTKGTVEFIRATDGSGASKWPPLPRVGPFETSTLEDGSGVLEFGIVAVGRTNTFSLYLSNPNTGSEPLMVGAITIDGPNATEFSVRTPPASPVPPGSSSEFSLRYSPVTPGRKSANLHIVTNAEGPLKSYDIILTGESVPDISVSGYPNTSLEEQDTVLIPLTMPGSSRNFVFTVRNTGGAELNGLAVTIDGPDSGEFSIAAPPAPSVPYQGSTTFTLRHEPGTSGRKTVSVRVASNVEGSKNPFDFTVDSASGAPDVTFQAADTTVTNLALQADGKILAAGLTKIIRFNPNGSSDLSFFSPGIGGGIVESFLVQKDGGILVCGDFQTINGQPRAGLARLHANGDLDEAFVPGLSRRVSQVAIQPDGKILVAGTFTTVAGNPHSYLVRLNADGTLDPGFNISPNNAVLGVALQPDGRILIGGYFDRIGQTTARYFARLHPDGSLDIAPTGFNSTVYRIVVQTDGRILISGDFTGSLARLFPDGSRDPSVAPIDSGFGVYDLALQADGKCLVAGRELGFGPARNYLARLNADGSLDTDFNPNANAAAVRLALQGDGKVIVTGDFSGIGSASRFRVARLENDPAPTILKNRGTSAVQWLRSGTAPEVNDVTFDLKVPDSPEWMPLGPAQRITGGWEMSGLSLPASGSLRARARSGASIIEAVTPILTTIESWRMQHFGNAANTGTGADDADPDRDGLTNFIEFAFGLSPVDWKSRELPSFKLTGETCAASFTPPAGTEDILYSAEWSPTLRRNAWQIIPDTGTGGTHEFRVPAGETRAFVRFIVTPR